MTTNLLLVSVGHYQFNRQDLLSIPPDCNLLDAIISTFDIDLSSSSGATECAVHYGSRFLYMRVLLIIHLIAKIRYAPISLTFRMKFNSVKVERHHALPELTSTSQSIFKKLSVRELSGDNLPFTTLTKSLSEPNIFSAVFNHQFWL
jgi:hypothetical protein